MMEPLKCGLCGNCGRHTPLPLNVFDMARRYIMRAKGLGLCVYIYI